MWIFFVESVCISIVKIFEKVCQIMFFIFHLLCSSKTKFNYIISKNLTITQNISIFIVFLLEEFSRIKSFILRICVRNLVGWRDNNLRKTIQWGKQCENIYRGCVQNPYNLNFMKNIKVNTAANVYRQRDCPTKT